MLRVVFFIHSSFLLSFSQREIPGTVFCPVPGFSLLPNTRRQKQAENRTKTTLSLYCDWVVIFLCLLQKGGGFVWRKFNNNPSGRSVGDCAVRAVSAALGVSWETAYAMMAAKGYSHSDMPSSNAIWGAVLRQHGFSRQNIPDTCPDCYTFADFARDNPEGVFVLGTGTHVATVRDGILMDAWDSSNEPVSFAWYRKD